MKLGVETVAETSTDEFWIEFELDYWRWERSVRWRGAECTVMFEGILIGIVEAADAIRCSRITLENLKDILEQMSSGKLLHA